MLLIDRVFDATQTTTAFEISQTAQQKSVGLARSRFKADAS
jgi:hypothetical protein